MNSCGLHRPARSRERLPSVQKATHLQLPDCRSNTLAVKSSDTVTTVRSSWATLTALILPACPCRTCTHLPLSMSHALHSASTY